jgi:hypothetical protein
LLDDLFAADEEGLFGVHNLHIYECKKGVKLFLGWATIKMYLWQIRGVRSYP